ncbi:MAG TPA: hypothetical protein PLO67_04910 [Saprospiraceae bacterium]|nr:hypothetical protein [Saprospiraceae bacterium]HPI05166.1 hypothetical protein [Saprospiraceae bacterium]
MGYDPNECTRKIVAKGRIPCDGLSLPYHCDTITGVGGDYHDECVDAGIIYFQVRVATCWNSTTNQSRYFPPSTFFRDCDALHSQDPAWQQRWCYCCCACFAKDTLVAVPGGYAEIYTIPQGAKVLTASAYEKGGLTWSESTVKFSMGTGEGPQPFMVYIGFEKEGTKDLICTQEQPFLLSNGKYTTAGKLTPGMQLVDKEGEPVDIQFVSLGYYDGAVHHIATAAPWTGSPAGHLILAGGVVAGDFEMQIKFGELPDHLKDDVDNTQPVIGTQAYDEAVSKLGNVSMPSDAHFQFRYKNTAGGNETSKQLGSGVFKTYSRITSPVPVGAQSLLTAQQARDVLKNGTQVTFSDPTPKYFFETAQIQLNAYFPDIVFYYDAFDMLPNVYAFDAYGKKIVQVSGGLARLAEFNFEGLIMAMAHGAGCFYGGAPKTFDGYTAVGQADRFAFGSVTRSLWLGDPAFGYIDAGIRQWMYMFDLINPDHRGGTDPISNPSIECREMVIQSAPFGGGLPPCAGGTPPRLIQLQVAQAVSLTQVELVFNLAINPETANNVANYEFSPEVKVLQARRSVEKDFVVELELETELTAGESYRVTAKNLQSALGTGMDPLHASAEFTAP